MKKYVFRPLYNFLQQEKEQQEPQETAVVLRFVLAELSIRKPSPTLTKGLSVSPVEFGNEDPRPAGDCYLTGET